MANTHQYTSMDRIISKVMRDIKDDTINVGDIIEWGGEALDFLKVYGNQEQTVAFIEVKNHTADFPVGLSSVLQLVKYEGEICEKNRCETIASEAESSSEDAKIYQTPIVEDNCKTTYYKPYFDMQIQFVDWSSLTYYKENFSPIRLANHTFFNDIVCKEKDQSIYQENCRHEYNILGTYNKFFKLSFEEGVIALAYLKSPFDTETGYPMIPDNPSYIAAVTYYIKWKIAERFVWSGREGFRGLIEYNEKKWIKYVGQAKSYTKMPKTIDDYQNLLESSHHLIPNYKRYYGLFGNLGRNQILST